MLGFALVIFHAVALGLFHDPFWGEFSFKSHATPWHWLFFLNTRLNLRFRLVQKKSQHIVLAFEPAEREGFEPPDL